LQRMAPLAPVEQTLVLTNASLRDRVLEIAPTLPPENVIAEPRPAGTCAALAWAAHLIAGRAGRESVMTCVHADWAIADTSGYRTTLMRAADVASAEQALVTVGIVPDRPDPGFGYIQPGAALHGDVRRVDRFIEKPDAARAEEMVRSGYLWNSGIFAWRVGDLLDELRAVTPEVWPALEAHPDDLEGFFSSVKPIAIDVGVLERSSRVLVIAGAFGWDDVGTWAALHRVRARDDSDNALHGDVHALESHGNVVHSDGASIVLYGVDDLVVVSRGALMLVTTKERAADLKTLLDSLPARLREA
jgi:mannose-1-phosphate guanylyltransferase